MSLLSRLRERFWFLPALMCLVAVVLSQVFVALDRVVTLAWLPEWANSLVYRVGESGSRDILGAIAAASLSVAGTTFSITIAVLALTSSSYGPRLVRNFMADRGNQAVLGVYVATFLYSLLVLRSVRSIGDTTVQQPEVFVPHLAVNLAVLLAMANVGVLVYFIHHISDSIQISTLAGSLRSDLVRTIDRLYPDEVGEAGGYPQRAAEALLPDGLVEEGDPVTAGKPGYVQSIDADEIYGIARDRDLVLALQVRPGEYVLEDTVIVVAHPPRAMDRDMIDAVRAAFHVANARSPFQDVQFAVQQLTEMAVRSLSPGINDPFTATNALDDLAAGLCLLVTRPTPSPARLDDDGRLRIHAPGFGAIELIDAVLDNMRWYATTSPSVMHAVLEFIHRVGLHTRAPSLRAHLAEQVELLRTAFDEAGNQAHDVQDFDRRAALLRRELLAHSGLREPRGGSTPLPEA